MSTLEIKRTNNTAISVSTSAATGSRVTLSHFMWAARELQEAIDAGMPMDTEVKIRNESGVNGVSISARAVLIQDIP
jgi:hypothetical protein